MEVIMRAPLPSIKEQEKLQRRYGVRCTYTLPSGVSANERWYATEKYRNKTYTQMTRAVQRRSDCAFCSVEKIER